MFQSRSMVMVVIAIVMLSLPPLVLAEEATPAAPSTSQIEQLQAQLAEMQQEMAAMRKAIEGSGDIPAERRPMMQQHMGQMEKHWQQMHDQCCMMDPAKCQHMGTKSN
jgi:hypothetical protein